MQGSEPPPARSRRNGSARRAGVLAIVVVALAATTSAAAASIAFPLVLEDPTSGSTIEVRPGARALHLVFFATWCPQCLEELPRLAELDARWGDRGYRLVLIGVPSRQSRERLAELVRQRRPPGVVGFDASGKAGEACGVRDLPAHLIVDRTGKVVLRAAELDASIERLVGELLRGR